MEVFTVCLREPGGWLDGDNRPETTMAFTMEDLCLKGYSPTDCHILRDVKFVLHI